MNQERRFQISNGRKRVLHSLSSFETWRTGQTQQQAPPPQQQREEKWNKRRPNERSRSQMSQWRTRLRSTLAARLARRALTERMSVECSALLNPVCTQTDKQWAHRGLCPGCNPGAPCVSKHDPDFLVFATPSVCHARFLWKTILWVISRFSSLTKRFQNFFVSDEWRGRQNHSQNCFRKTKKWAQTQNGEPENQTVSQKTKWWVTVLCDHKTFLWAQKPNSEPENQTVSPKTHRKPNRELAKPNSELKHKSKSENQIVSFTKKFQWDVVIFCRSHVHANVDVSDKIVLCFRTSGAPAVFEIT